LKIYAKIRNDGISVNFVEEIEGIEEIDKSERNVNLFDIGRD
jgi:hypothetical protein